MLVKRAPSWRECQVEICTMQHTVSNLFTYIRMHFHPISPWAFENTFRCMFRSKRCHSKRGKMGYISGVLCQKQVSRAGTSIYVQQILWDVIIYSCPGHMLLAMMTSSNGTIFRVSGPFLRGIHRSPVNSPHKGQWRRALMFLWFAPE